MANRCRLFLLSHSVNGIGILISIIAAGDLKFIDIFLVQLQILIYAFECPIVTGYHILC